MTVGSPACHRNDRHRMAPRPDARHRAVAEPPQSDVMVVSGTVPRRWPRRSSPLRAEPNPSTSSPCACPPRRPYPIQPRSPGRVQDHSGRCLRAGLPAAPESCSKASCSAREIMQKAYGRMTSYTRFRFPHLRPRSQAPEQSLQPAGEIRLMRSSTSRRSTSRCPRLSTARTARDFRRNIRRSIWRRGSACSTTSIRSSTTTRSS